MKKKTLNSQGTRGRVYVYLKFRGRNIKVNKIYFYRSPDDCTKQNWSFRIVIGEYDLEQQAITKASTAIKSERKEKKEKKETRMFYQYQGT